MCGLREPSEAYGDELAQEKEALRPENTILWKKFNETAETWHAPTVRGDPYRLLHHCNKIELRGESIRNGGWRAASVVS
jgi:hypothetical protein